MTPPPRSGASLRAAGVAIAASAALLAPAGAGAQVPGPPVPCVTLQAADAAAGDLFACALAMEPEQAAVGSVLDDDLGSGSGAVYVFGRGGGGAWAQRAKLLAADGAAGDELGFAVGISGGRIAAGAPFRNETGSRSGAVYVFAGGGSQWAQAAKLVPPGLGANDELGRAVAVSGAVVAAGAPGDDDRGSSAGAVYVFDLEGGTGGNAVQKLTASDGAAGDGFGFGLALAGGTLLVGAPFGDEGGAQAGAVYAFERQEGGWVQTAKLTAADRRASSLFGWSVALAGDRAAIGARLDDGTANNAGAAYVFGRAGGAWSQQARLVPPDLVAGDELGSSVALTGDAVVAGARFGAVEGLAGAGAAYVFEREGGAWVVARRLIASSPGAGDELGFAVGAAGSAVFAGAYRDDDGGTDAGSFCVFEEVGGTPPDPPDPDPDPDPPQTDIADAGVSKTNGGSEVTCNTSTTYTVTAFNAGTRPISARVRDDLPPPLGCAWNCREEPGGGECGDDSGEGDIDQVVSLPVGAAVVFDVFCTIPRSAPATLSNTATVTITAGGPDENAANDSATDVDTVACPAALLVSKDDGVEEVVAGGDVTYAITAINSGPRQQASGRVRDLFADGLDCDWTCSGAGGATCGDPDGSGDIDQVVGLPIDGTISFVAECTIDPSIGGNGLVNVVSIEPAGGVPGSGNTFTDVNALRRVADLGVTKVADRMAVAPGDTLRYTVTVTNDGPSTSAAAVVTDDFPDGLDCSWSCTEAGGAQCGAATGGGDLAETVSLPPEGAVTYRADCVAGETATGSLVNTASATNPVGVTDPDPDDNAATATVEVLSTVNLSITKSDFVTQGVAGQAIEYTLEIANAGPDDAEGVRIVDPLPANLVGASWICGGQSGGGDLDVTVDLPAGASIACGVLGTTPPGFCGPLDNTASVLVPPGFDDPDFSDNTATDSNLIFPPPGNGPPPVVNLCASKDVVTGPHPPGSTVVYEVLLFNGGPDPALAGEFFDQLPMQVTQATAVADSGAVAVLPGGAVLWNGAVPAGQVVTITITGIVDGQVGEVVVNQGELSDLNAGASTLTDDPRTAPPMDPTVFTIAGVLEIPTLGAAALAALAALLAAVALRRLRRRPAG